MTDPAVEKERDRERRREELRRAISAGKTSDARWQREDLLFDLEEAWSEGDLERADVLLALLVGNLGRERMRVAEDVIVERIAGDAD